jgi:hypothetical protein
MKAGNGGTDEQACGSEGLSTQVASAFGELLRVQEELQGRLRTLTEREAELSGQQHALDQRNAELFDREVRLEERRVALDSRLR